MVPIEIQHLLADPTTLSKTYEKAILNQKLILILNWHSIQIVLLFLFTRQ